MVIERSEGSNAGRDRGQLILIGALALAFILLGIVVVYNGVLFTETISSSSTAQSASHAELADEEVERGVQGVIQRENLEDVPDPETEIENYDSDYLNGTTGSRPAMTGISFDEVVLNASVSDDDLGNETIGSPENESIGHFVLNVGTESEEDVMVRNNSDNLLTVKIDEDDLTIEDHRNGYECDVNFAEGQNTVRIDLITSAVNASNDCETPFITRDDEFDELEIETTGEVNGTYELVYKDDEADDGAWTVSVSYAYESSDVSVEKEREIDVYGDRP